MPTSTPPYLPKDFVETDQGLCFAVVQSGVERCEDLEKVLGFLRYIKQRNESGGRWRKVSTHAANDYLAKNYPEYLHHSGTLDADLHGVEVSRIFRHHQPRMRLQEILGSPKRDTVEQDLYDLCQLYQHNGFDLAQLGVTGSLLIGAQQASSDIDLVFYGRDAFHKARAMTAALIERQQLAELAENDWQDAYARRSCDLGLEDYIWHERRKYNKALVNGRKFDLSLVAESSAANTIAYEKLGATKLQCKITEDRHSFDYPALYGLDHDTIKSAACFIATYTGQAVIGETVEIAGLLEHADDGSQRIVVGSSREAPGEYIKVIQCGD